MMCLEVVLAGVILGSLTFYVLLGGADFGAGVWHLFARGSRASAERQLIGDAIAPIWEANHVWLITVITVLFAAFPPVYALLSTVLHIPIVILLIGIVLRGSAFAFRHYDVKPDGAHLYWEQLFAASSLITPVLFGIILGSITSGRVTLTGKSFWSVFVQPWLQPFPLTVGVFALVLFAYLAAVYLILEARDEGLQELFRRRAIIAALVAAFLEETVMLLARTGATRLWSEVHGTLWGGLAELSSALFAMSGIYLLWRRHFWWARLCAIGQVTIALWTLGIAQFPYLVPPSLTVFNAAAPQATLNIIFAVLCFGALLLFPSLFYLYRVFKSSPVGRGGPRQAG